MSRGRNGPSLVPLIDSLCVCVCVCVCVCAAICATQGQKSFQTILPVDVDDDWLPGLLVTCASLGARARVCVCV